MSRIKGYRRKSKNRMDCVPGFWCGNPLAGSAIFCAAAMPVLALLALIELTTRIFASFVLLSCGFSAMLLHDVFGLDPGWAALWYAHTTPKYAVFDCNMPKQWLLFQSHSRNLWKLCLVRAFTSASSGRRGLQGCGSEHRKTRRPCRNAPIIRGNNGLNCRPLITAPHLSFL